MTRKCLLIQSEARLGYELHDIIEVVKVLTADSLTTLQLNPLRNVMLNIEYSYILIKIQIARYFINVSEAKYYEKIIAQQVY